MAPLFPLAYAALSGGIDEAALLDSTANGLDDIRKVIASAKLSPDQVHQEINGVIQTQANDKNIDSITKGAIADKIYELIYGREDLKEKSQKSPRRITVTPEVFVFNMVSSHAV